MLGELLLYTMSSRLRNIDGYVDVGRVLSRDITGFALEITTHLTGRLH